MIYSKLELELMSRAIAGHHATVFAESVTDSFAERACSSCERQLNISNGQLAHTLDELANVTGERESLFDLLDKMDRLYEIPDELRDTPGFRVYERLFLESNSLNKVREELAEDINREAAQDETLRFTPEDRIIVTEAGAKAVISDAVETAVKVAVGAEASK
jgi:hypothetical protein